MEGLASPRFSALPRQAMWFFVVSPPILALLFDPSCVKDPSHVARATLAITAYTILTGLAVHFSFEWLAKRVDKHAFGFRLLAHALFCVLVVGIVTAVQLPIVTLLYPEIGGSEVGVFERGVLVSFVYLILASFVGRLQQQAVRERMRAHEERVAALESRLAMLQAQMQPHFLFNSLNVCAGLVHDQPDVAEQTLDRLAGFLRYALESTERRLVSVEEEAEAVRSYLEVQHQRFGDRLRYQVRTDPAARLHRVPPMLLQPLVENALLHGIRDRDQGNVEVDASVSEGALHIRVSDDGVGPDASTHHGTGLGLRNVRERLRLVYGEGATLETGRSAQGGFECLLRVPLGALELACAS